MVEKLGKFCFNCFRIYKVYYCLCKNQYFVMAHGQGVKDDLYSFAYF